MDARRPGNLPQHREDLSARLRLLRLLHRRRFAGTSGLARSRRGNREPPFGHWDPQLWVSVHGDQPGGHDDRTVDAVLSSSIGRRKGRDGAPVSSPALGRHPRMRLYRSRRVVHHCRLRGNAPCQRTHCHLGLGRCGPGAPSPCGRGGVPVVCSRPVQRVALCRIDSPDLDLVRRVRRAGVRVRS